jgi:cholesterol transport system auxiliary component
MKKTMIALLLSSAVGTLCTGCNSGGQAGDQRRFYLLEVEREGPPRSVSLPGRLVVQPTRLSPGYDKKELVYRLSPSRYESDYYHQFVTDAGSQTAEQMRQWLRKSRSFSQVLVAGSVADATHILESSITALYGDFRDKNQPQAVLDLQVFLIDVRTRDLPVVFHKEYAARAPLRENTAEALVQGYDQALREILTALENDLAAVVAGK